MAHPTASVQPTTTFAVPTVASVPGQDSSSFPQERLPGGVRSISDPVADAMAITVVIAR